MTLLELYQTKLSLGEISPDPIQAACVAQLEQLHQTLLHPHKRNLPKGLYLWGSVGIGKTFLMDLFYQSLPFPQKIRMHFYTFMSEIHQALHALQGTRDPLVHIGKAWAKKYQVICFDELIVTDIADAMVLGGLFEAFFHAGICLVFTTNVPPDDLYKNGIQRSRFLPAIAALKKHTEVIHLMSQQDYRAIALQKSQQAYYWYPVSVTSEAALEAYFQQCSEGIEISGTLEIAHRSIVVKKYANQVAWFDFMAICGIPRSFEDYLILVRQFPIIIVSNLRTITEQELDLARSFIRFIDVLYDHQTRLMISAEVLIEQIYPKGKLEFEFARTRSRLKQMTLADK
ncbi:MAG: cell division protein ZapE [Gammaproteobacteria bacterium]